MTNMRTIAVLKEFFALQMSSPHIPTDSLSVIGEYALDNVKDLTAFNAIAHGFRTATTCIDSKAWELEFKARDPDLHACISACGDERNSWRERVRRIVDTTKMFSEQALVPGFASVDVVLHNHPSHGFQVNIGVDLVRDAVVVHSLRKEAGVQSSSEIFLGPLGAPFNDDPTKAEPAFTTLYLVSIDGVEVSTLSGPEELIRVVRGSGELSHWRFVFLPSNDTETAVPAVCRFAPTPVQELRSERRALEMTEYVGRLDEN
eukprot:CAMPEP_0172617386 /NCGR_PEP_ID=MMETSP1068-20121228/70219_1 /TAXON_ID=35684 /ORGANISM="Pseudopedinella elastica, Strain CCMP716" /LENGTH=259 /DNA_ID=CAMNT_0013423137 /DNA_START=48 /DNA_END=827 /DNA_ORIENTATION=+